MYIFNLSRSKKYLRKHRFYSIKNLAILTKLNDRFIFEGRAVFKATKILKQVFMSKLSIFEI